MGFFPHSSQKKAQYCQHLGFNSSLQKHETISSCYFQGIVMVLPWKSTHFYYFDVFFFISSSTWLKKKISVFLNKHLSFGSSWSHCCWAWESEVTVHWGGNAKFAGNARCRCQRQVPPPAHSHIWIQTRTESVPAPQGKSRVGTQGESLSLWLLVWSSAEPQASQLPPHFIDFSPIINIS